MATAAARRYARAVFELANEEGRIEDWSKRLTLVCGVLSQPDARAVLANPSISVQRRQELTKALMGDSAGREAVNLAKLLVGANRLSECAAIVEEFQKLADEAAGRVRAVATTAVPLNPADSERLQKQLSDRLGREVLVSVNVDKDILGGLVLKIGDRVIDASVASRLEQLRQKLAGA